MDNDITILDLARKHNFHVQQVISFFKNKGKFVKEHTKVTNELFNLFERNIALLRVKATLESEKGSKIDGPKILGKIDLPVSNRPDNYLKLPRLLAAAKEFNIGQDTLIDFLISMGFDKSDLKPTSKLTEDMYRALQLEFSKDKAFKKKAVSLDLPKSSKPENSIWNGEITDIFDGGRRAKITPIREREVVKSGIKVIEEVLDLSMWLIAYKDDWTNLKIFTVGDRLNFKIEFFTKGDGTRIRKAIPFDSEQEKPKAFQEAGNVGKGVQIKNPVILESYKSNQQEKIASTITENKSSNTSDQQSTIMEQRISPMQKIIFGSPGTGKSFKIDGADNSCLTQLNIIDKSLDLIKTVFHPEYTYGDFMGKLMPYTNDDGGVEYRFYAGHFLKSLGRAYKNIILAKIELEKLKDEEERNYKREINKSNKKDFSDDETYELQRRKDSIPAPAAQNVALVIDEINRGNSAAIFGTIFQLLDRNPSGWSSYHIRISDLENNELHKEITLEYKEYKKASKVEEVSYKFDGVKCTESDYKKYLEYIFDELPENEKVFLFDRNIKLPPNLSIIATMNTSDNSIYFMDSAFKRRWDWEFIDITSDKQKESQNGRVLFDGSKWDDFVDNLNSFIKQNGKRIRKIEDKQIGYYFIKERVISKESIKNKLQFFLWDSIFSNDKKPLEDLLGQGKSLVTFGDFIKECDAFIAAINSKSFIKE